MDHSKKKLIPCFQETTTLSNCLESLQTYLKKFFSTIHLDFQVHSVEEFKLLLINIIVIALVQIKIKAQQKRMQHLACDCRALWHFSECKFIYFHFTVNFYCLLILHYFIYFQIKNSQLRSSKYQTHAQLEMEFST